MRCERRCIKHTAVLCLTEEPQLAMRFLICAFALVAVALAAPQYQQQALAPQVYTKEGLAKIVRQDQDQTEDGAYRWSYETENGISASETGVLKAVGSNGEPVSSVEGGYQYTAPDGTPVAIRYRSGEEGFIAEGSHIPVAPPIPEEILRGLAWNAAHPEEEAQWDPEYNKPVPKPVYSGYGRK